MTTTSREPRAGTGEAPEDITAVPVRHPGRWVAVAVIAVLVAMLVNSVVNNPAYHWDTVGKSMYDRRLTAATKNVTTLTVWNDANSGPNGIPIPKVGYSTLMSPQNTTYV